MCRAIATAATDHANRTGQPYDTKSIRNVFAWKSRTAKPSEAGNNAAEIALNRTDATSGPAIAQRTREALEPSSARCPTSSCKTLRIACALDGRAATMPCGVSGLSSTSGPPMSRSIAPRTSSSSSSMSWPLGAARGTAPTSDRARPRSEAIRRSTEETASPIARIVEPTRTTE